MWWSDGQPYYQQSGISDEKGENNGLKQTLSSAL